MPYGQTRWVGRATPAEQQIIPTFRGSLPGAAPTPAEVRSGDSDIWYHHTVDLADWSADAKVHIDFPAAVTAVEIFAATSVVLYVALGNNATAAAGGYQLYHPGGGFLAKPVPRTHTVTIVAADVLAPTVPAVPATRVEVWGFAGVYALEL